jgi:hypothetical protein
MSLLEISIYVALLSVMLVSVTVFLFSAQTVVPEHLTIFADAAVWDITLRSLVADTHAAQTLRCEDSALIIEHATYTAHYIRVDTQIVRRDSRHRVGTTQLLDDIETFTCTEHDSYISITIGSNGQSITWRNFSRYE